MTGRPTKPTAWRRLRYRVRTAATERPGLYLPFARRKYPGPSPEVVSSETELVIDGYTRAASTFAVYALQLSQPQPVRLAHHLHAPAQLIQGVRQGLPVLCLIREPRGTILSQLAREPDVDMRDALVAYRRFYTCLLPHLDRMIVADFDQVTGDFGAVIERLNARFAMTLTPFAHTEAGVREVTRLVRHRGTLSPVLLGFESGTATLPELKRELARLAATVTAIPTGDAWVPSTSRDQVKDALLEQWQEPALASLQSQAREVYHLVRQHAAETETKPSARTGHDDSS
jgi:hypothetical protein